MEHSFDIILHSPVAWYWKLHLILSHKYNHCLFFPQPCQISFLGPDEILHFAYSQNPSHRSSLFSSSWTTNLIRSSSDKPLSWFSVSSGSCRKLMFYIMLTRVTSAAYWFRCAQNRTFFGYRANYLESNLTASVTLHLSSSFCSVVSYLSIRVYIYSGGSQLR